MKESTNEDITAQASSELDENVILQGSDNLDYNTCIRSKDKQQNRFLCNLQQACDIINDAMEKVGRADLSILEIGFNDGELMCKLSEIYPDAKFIGLEIRKEPVEEMVELGYDCRLVDTEMFDEVFKANETFDIIYGYAVLHHTSNPYKSLESAIKLLKPGGTVVFVCEAHKLDLLSFMYYTYKRSWYYEKYTLKMGRRRFKKLLSRYTSDYYVEYDGNGLAKCFKRFNELYCKMKMNKIPFLNGMTIHARIMKSDKVASCEM